MHASKASVMIGNCFGEGPQSELTVDDFRTPMHIQLSFFGHFQCVGNLISEGRHTNNAIIGGPRFFSIVMHLKIPNDVIEY